MTRVKQQAGHNALNKMAIEASRRLCQGSFYEFTKEAWHTVDPDPFVDNFHVEALCNHLQALAEGKILPPRLCINIPPGTGKSLIASVLYTAWKWTRDASQKIISVSHSRERATDDSLRTRDVVMSDWYQERWQVELKEDQNSKMKFQTNKMGFRNSLPMSRVTGARGNLVIVDDPHSVDDAASQAERSKAVKTFLTAIPSRLNRQSRDAIVVIMQRLHEEDVVGAILERPELGYTHLVIPMEAWAEPAPPTQIGWQDPRKAGELLFPDMFSEKDLAALKASMGPFAYSGQYQQEPVPLDDGFFKREWFEEQIFDPKVFMRDTAHKCRFYLTTDHAHGDGARNDYQVARVWAVDDQRHVWLVDSFRDKCLLAEFVGVAKSASGKMRLKGEGIIPLIKKWKVSVWFPENDPAFKSLYPMVKSAMRETNVFCRTHPLTTAGDKVTKATGYQSYASMGMVHLPRGPIADEALTEYVRFPVGKHDDQVDADALICRALTETKGVIHTKVAEQSREVDYDFGSAVKHSEDEQNFFF